MALIASAYWNYEPAWSPDGGRIAFTAPGPQGSFICLVDGPGAAPRNVSGSERCGYLDWTPDGRAIYFSSNRGTSTQVWKVAAEGGEAVQVTRHGGRVPALSSDGRYLYWLRMAADDGRDHLWRFPLGGGQEEKVLEFVDARLGNSGIAFKHYRPGQQPLGPYLEFFRLPPPRPSAYPDLRGRFVTGSPCHERGGICSSRNPTTR